MGYDKVFYSQYRDYLNEPVVRQNHDRMFARFFRFTEPDPLHVVDLGCGMKEYAMFGSWNTYVGLDVNDVPPYKSDDAVRSVRADYSDLSFVDQLPYAPNVIVSMFSIECCLSAATKYDLYEELFARIPTLKYVLVAGFFYGSKRDQETVGETGGIVSYQTIEDPAKFISRTFDEFRLHMLTPSKMFADDVIEVWKILSRR